MAHNSAVVDVINKRINELPLNKTKLAEQIGLSYELLRRTLNGERKLSGDELVNLCVILGLNIEDFSPDD